jgi:Leucine-rich repeat (LRR) protein
MHFFPYGSLYLRNVFRGGVIPQDIFQHLNESYLSLIDLKQNNLIEIDGKIFQNLNHLNRLDVSDNSISILSYSGLHRLSHLNIDNNNLREVPNFCSENGSSLAHHLRFLGIVNNRVQIMKTDDFQCAVRIHVLLIWNNPLREIQNNVFAPLKSLRSLTIFPSRHTLKHIQSYSFNASNLQSLSLENANFKFRHQTFDPDNIFRFCPWLHTLVLSYNSVPSDSETTIRMFGTLRRLQRLALYGVGWNTLPRDLFHRLVTLKSLQLGNNNIMSLSLNNPFKYMKGLDFLGLSANKLNTFHKNSLPDNIVDGLKTLDLASNPYICNCNLIWFIKWLNNTKSVIQQYPHHYYCVMPESWNVIQQYPHQYYCVVPESWKGRLLNTFSEDCAEHQRLTVTIIVAISCSILVVMAITTITVYKMRWHIRYWIYLIRAKHRNYSQLSNMDYVYDGFVVYCDEDKKWVHEKLVPVLEVEYGHKLCIHYRDFQVGKLIVDNIVENMKESRKVILVMSNTFARSEWCPFEVLLAHERFLGMVAIHWLQYY